MLVYLFNIYFYLRILFGYSGLNYSTWICSCGIWTLSYDVGSSAPTRGWIQVPLHWKCSILATGHQGSPHTFISNIKTGQDFIFIWLSTSRLSLGCSVLVWFLECQVSQLWLYQNIPIISIIQYMELGVSSASVFRGDGYTWAAAQTGAVPFPSSPSKQKGGSDGRGISPPSHVDPTLHEWAHLGVCFRLAAFFLDYVSHVAFSS